MAKVNPSYYSRGTSQVWDFIRDQDLGFHLGNAIKYICRAGHKDSYTDDLTKAIHYLENELNHYVITQQPSHRVPPSVLYTERFELAEDAEGSDRRGI